MNKKKIVFRGLMVLIIMLFSVSIFTIWNGYRHANDLVATNPNLVTATKTRFSEWQQYALLAIEDPDFFDHHGVDLVTDGAGLTTITQALVKRTYFDDFRPGFAKIEQTLAAIGYDIALKKEDQLSLFFELAYLGSSSSDQVIGFEAASKDYFNKPFGDIAENEFLQLVAMLIAPDHLNPVTSPEALSDRVARIETLLAGNCKPTGLRDVYLTACGEDHDS